MGDRLVRLLIFSLLILTWVFIVAAILGIARDLAENGLGDAYGLAYAL